MAGRIPQTFIQDLVNQTDIVQLIESYLPLKKQGNNFVACCPFHHEKTPSFNVVARKQYYHCFGCGESGNAISFIMQYLNQDFVTAIETLSNRLGLSIPIEQNKTERRQQTDLFALLEKVTHYFEHCLKTKGNQAIEYLKSRGLDGETAKQFTLGYAPESWDDLVSIFPQDIEGLTKTGMLIRAETGKVYCRYRHRIIFPIYDKQGRVIGFGGRAIDNSQKPKYLNSPETILFQKNNELYGLHQLLEINKNPNRIIVVEGYMDVIALFQADIPYAVATLGTATGAKHIQHLSKYTHEIIFCFDGDEAGKKAAWRALENALPYLNSGVNIKFIFLPEQHDPDSLVREIGKEQFLKLCDSALTLDEYLFSKLSININLESNAGKSQFFEIIKPYLTQVPISPYRTLLIEKLSRIIRIDTHRIELLINKTTNPLSIKKSQLKFIERTPLRLAVALIIQYPELVQKLGEINLDIESDDMGETLLLKLIDFITQNPATHTGLILEHFRNTSYFSTITSLSAWDHKVPQKDLTQELQDIFTLLNKHKINHEIELLLTKARSNLLSADEKNHLKILLNSKHQTQSVE